MRQYNLMEDLQPDVGVCFGCGKERLEGFREEEYYRGGYQETGALQITHSAKVMVCSTSRAPLRAACVRQALAKLHDEICWWCGSRDFVRGGACKRCTPLIEQAITDAGEPKELCSVPERALGYVGNNNVSSRKLLWSMLGVIGRNLVRDTFRGKKIGSSRFSGDWCIRLHLTAKQQAALESVIRDFKLLLEVAEHEGYRNGSSALQRMINGSTTTQDFEDLRTKNDRELLELDNRLDGGS